MQTTSFNDLPISDQEKRNLSKVASQTRAFLGITVSPVYLDGDDLIVSVHVKGSDLTDAELSDRALSIFDKTYPLERVHVFRKLDEKQKFALTHDARYLLSFKDEPFIARVGPLATASITGETGTWARFTGAARLEYAVFTLDIPVERLSEKKLLQAEKWFKREMIQQKEAEKDLLLTIEDLRRFFDERPGLNQTAIMEEAGFTYRYLRLLLTGERQITFGVSKKMLPVLERYGFKQFNHVHP